MWGGVYGFAICASPKFGFFLISTFPQKQARLEARSEFGRDSSTRSSQVYIPQRISTASTRASAQFSNTFVSTGKIINDARATLDLKFVKQYWAPKKARLSFKKAAIDFSRTKGLF